MTPRETPHPAVERLLTGHEHRMHNRCWRQRGTPSLLLIHTRSGHAEIRIDGKQSQIVSAGDTVLWLAGTTQDFGTRDNAAHWELIWAHFHPREQWHDWLAWPMIGRGVGLIPTPPDRLRARIDDALVEMDAYARSAFPQASEFALNALERALLWLGAANPEPTARIHESVQEAVLFISRHLDRSLSVQEVADAVHLSPSRIAHLFKHQMGVSPARFIEQRRMERAQALLESSSLPIHAVSAAAGFSSQFYFAARFRTHMGMSPSAWRRRGRFPR